MPNYTLDFILLEREPGLWIGQCLQYDLGAQAKTLPDLLYEIQRSVVGYIAICSQREVEPFLGLDSAPTEYWEMWKEATAEVHADVLPFRSKRSVPVPITRYRLAA